jgi:hypothetical protein
MSRYLANSWLAVALCGVIFGSGQAQEPIQLQGDVQDERGDLIVGTTLHLTGERAESRVTTSDAQGRFRFAGLRSGAYHLKVEAPGFAAHESDLAIENAPRRLTITLYPTVKADITITITNNDEANQVALDPSRAAGAQLISEAQLKLMPDDPDRLAELLQLLATSSGSAPAGASVKVDGFTHEGRLPPSAAIGS